MPASEEKSISQFTTASSISPNSLVFVSTPNASAPSGYDSEKATASELGEAIVNDFEYTQDLNTENKRVTGAINELHSSIGADAYDDTATYAVGDLCIHNNTLYKCTTAITTAEAWNASHWTATSIADELALRQPKTDNILATTDKTVVGAINELKSDCDNNFDYSSNETAIGSWFGVKTIYRQYVDIGALPNNSTKQTKFYNGPIQDLINLRIIARTNAGDSFISIPYLSSSNVFNIECDVEVANSKSYVNITTHRDASGLVAFAIIEYTKR